MAESDDNKRDTSNDEDNKTKLKKFEKELRDLSPGLGDMLDDAKPYLAAIANVPSRLPIHRLEHTLAEKVLDASHDIRVREIDVQIKKEEEITKRQESAQRHAAAVLRQGMWASVVELILLLSVAGVLALLHQAELATLALAAGVFRYGQAKDAMKALGLQREPKQLKAVDD